MSTLSKEQIKAIVKGNNFQSVTDVTNYLKDIFKDIIQELMEAELEEKLGYAKEERSAKNTDNCRNGYSTKTLKVNLEKLRFKFQGTVKESLRPKIIPKYQRNVSGIEEK